MSIRLIILLAMILAAGEVPAAPSTPVPGGAEVLGFVGSLLVVVASILVFGWLYSRFRPGMAQGADSIRIVAMRPLGPKERLVVVELAGEQLLIGVSPGGLRKLHRLEQRLDTSSTGAAAGGFAERLKALRGGTAG
jgi:flagellar protein FliO/FliZ